MYLVRIRAFFLFFCCFSFSATLLAQAPANDAITNAVVLTSSTSCPATLVSGTVVSATNSSVAVNSCGGTADDDVWYKLVAQGMNTTISVTNMSTGNSSITKSGGVLEVFYSSSGNSSTLTYLTCAANANNSTNSMTISNYSLTAGATYYIRVYSKGTTTIGAGLGSFNICVTHTPIPAPPANDDCSGAVSLTLGTIYTSGTVWGATNSNVAATCTGTPDDDVWYKFTANSNNATIALSAIGSDLSSSGAVVELFSGTCGALTSIACATGTNSISTLSLTSGSIYYIRVYSSGTGYIGTAASGSTFSITVSGPPTVSSTKTNEVFQQVTLSPANVLLDPWEITYGSDGYLWITESKGYKVYRMDPNTGVKTTVLDISQNSTFLPSADQTFDVQFASTQNPWPQGGMAGLALHPDFMNSTSPKKYVYISYVYSYTGYVNNRSTDSLGAVFVNRIVRFTYNTTTAKLESPISLCDTLPGSSDHNSQRLIVAPVNGVNYLFYGQGDMGAGQFANKYRLNKAQITASYEGKILRFNLEPDNDAGTLDKWIPNDNPFNGTAQSAVWSTGIRNNQGFAYANINGTDLLYGSSHGPYSDDEINIIEKSRNYGHPLVVGYAADNNYNGSSVGAPPYYTTLPAGANLIPIINSETTNAATIGASYKDPIFSMYPESQATLHNIYLTNPANSGWPSVAPSGMDIYTSSAIPGWKNSLLVSYLKGGRVMRLKLNSDGLGINYTDTVGYFWSTNRFRDVALSPDGKSVFTIIDKSSTTSGPTSTTPMVSACPGCVLKYTFLGYNTVNSRSAIPTSIPVTTGTNNTCNSATTVTIDASNNTLWVPITGPDGNILAEIKANGNTLGTVTASFYTNSGTIRKDAGGKPYLDRNLTITPQNQPTSGVVDIRLYITNAELNALIGASGSGVGSVANLHIFKNSDACGSTIRKAVLDITPAIAEGFGTATNGYVLQASISSFSSFYFGSPGIIPLPLQVVTFKGAWQRNDAFLQWETANEQNSAYFIVERSADGTHFEKVGLVDATGNTSAKTNYTYTDEGAALLPTNVLYYRLKSIDNDGKFTYSNIVILHPQHNFDVMVFPNPVKEQLTIRINNQDVKEVTVQITDMQGRVLYTSKEQLTKSISNLNIDVRRWKQQLYIVKIVDSKAQVLATQKFEKL